MALELKEGELANLLSLDGGGIKGISSLVIIKAIMDKVGELEGSPSTPRKPVDYFHLAGGTSTGGIIAVMLFRLRMTPQQAIDAYMKVGADVFGKKAKNGPASFPAEPLLAAVDKIAEQYGDKTLKGGALLVDNQAKMFLTATMQERGESILLRSYTPPKDAVPVSEEGKALFDFNFVKDLNIKDACRATSAAPTYFPELVVPVDKGGKDKVVFWDGGLLNNNPIDQVWRARLDLVGETSKAPQVGCVLSIGTSWCSADPPSMVDMFIPEKSTKDGVFAAVWNGFVSAFRATATKISDWIPVLDPVAKMIPFLTNTEAKHLDFSRYMKRLRNRQDADAKTAYFRFNTPTGKVYIDMSDHAKMAWLRDFTKEWVASKDAGPWITDCAKILAKKKAT